MNGTPGGDHIGVYGASTDGIGISGGWGVLGPDSADPWPEQFSSGLGVAAIDASPARVAGGRRRSSRAR